MRRVLAALDGHFFEPGSLRTLGVVRIVLVATQLSYLVFGPNLFFGEAGSVLRRQTMLANALPETFAPIPTLQILMVPFGDPRPEPMFLQLVWGLAVVSGLAALVGLFSRLSLLFLAWSSTLIVAHLYSYREFHHPEALLIIMLWVLALGPVSGLSIDRLRRRVQIAGAALRFRPSSEGDDLSPLARWPLRVGQWLLALAYLSATVSKFTVGGLEWVNGYTLTYYMLTDGTRYDVPFALWLAAHPTLAQLLSVGAVLFEGTFFLAILFPRVAWAYVLTGTAMHLLIFATQRPPFFTFIALYVVFLEPLRDSWRSARAWVARRSRGGERRTAGVQPPPARATFIYDGGCSFRVRCRERAPSAHAPATLR